MALLPFGRNVWLASKRDARILGDDVANCDSRELHCIVIVPGAQIGDHAPANIANLAVGQNAFKPIGYVNAIFVVVNGKQDEDAAIRALPTHLPLVFKLIGPVGGVFPVEIAYGDDGHLRVGLGVVELGAERIELCNSFRRKHMREVADIVGWLREVGDLFCMGCRKKQDEQGCQKQPCAGGAGAAHRGHYSLLYEKRAADVPRAWSARSTFARTRHALPTIKVITAEQESELGVARPNKLET